MAFEFAYQIDNAASPAVKVFNCGEVGGVSQGDLLQLVAGEAVLATVGSGTLLGFATHDADEDEDVNVVICEDTVMRVPYSGSSKTTLTVSDKGTYFDINATADELDLDATDGDLYLLDYDSDRTIAFVMIKDQDEELLNDITATSAELNENDLSVVGAMSKVKVISMAPADFSDNSEVDTGFDLPDTAIVTNVFLNVSVAETTQSTKTVDVGTNGSGSDDPNGFLAAVSVAATGLVKGTLLNSGQTLGALLAVDEDGAAALVPEPDITSGGESITVSAGDASGLSEATFDIIVEYIEVA